MDVSQTSLEQCCHYARLIQERQLNGNYHEDGPTSDEANTLIVAVEDLIRHNESPSPYKVWVLFQLITAAEFSWLFPERDAIGLGMTAALQRAREGVDLALKMTDPQLSAQTRQYVENYSRSNLARRSGVLGGDSVSGWRYRIALNLDTKLSFAIGVAILVFALFGIGKSGFLSGIALPVGVWLTWSKGRFLYLTTR
jgi:hypothetical protein